MLALHDQTVKRHHRINNYGVRSSVESQKGTITDSKLFRWELEGRYSHRHCTAITPFWFSREHLVNIASALLALNWRNGETSMISFLIRKRAHIQMEQYPQSSYTTSLSVSCHGARTRTGWEMDCLSMEIHTNHNFNNLLNIHLLISFMILGAVLDKTNITFISAVRVVTMGRSCQKIKHVLFPSLICFRPSFAFNFQSLGA